MVPHFNVLKQSSENYVENSDKGSDGRAPLTASSLTAEETSARVGPALYSRLGLLQ